MAAMTSIIQQDLVVLRARVPFRTPDGRRAAPHGLWRGLVVVAREDALPLVAEGLASLPGGKTLSALAGADPAN
jgi:hypothetical protein